MLSVCHVCGIIIQSDQSQRIFSSICKWRLFLSEPSAPPPGALPWPLLLSWLSPSNWSVVCQMYLCVWLLGAVVVPTYHSFPVRFEFFFWVRHSFFFDRLCGVAPTLPFFSVLIFIELRYGNSFDPLPTTSSPLRFITSWCVLSCSDSSHVFRHFFLRRFSTNFIETVSNQNLCNSFISQIQVFPALTCPQDFPSYFLPIVSAFKVPVSDFLSLCDPPVRILG